MAAMTVNEDLSGTVTLVAFSTLAVGEVHYGTGAVPLIKLSDAASNNCLRFDNPGWSLATAGASDTVATSDGDLVIRTYT